MKRFAWILATVVLAVAALFAILFNLLPWDSVATRVGQQIAAWTGREVSLRGEPEFDFFPGLTITMKDVQVAGPDGMADAAIVSMDRLEGKVRLWPLFIGRVEIGSFTMVRPLIRVVRDNGARNWSFDSGAAALQLAFAGDVPLGMFVLEDGTLTYENREEAISERLDSLNLSVEWASVRQALSVTGSGIWRGEQLNFSASAATPFEYLNGRATNVEVRLNSAPLVIAFSGEGSEIADPLLTGRLSLSTPSLRNFAAWLGRAVGPGSTLGQASISGSASFRRKILSVEDSRLVLDNNNATGALNITMAAVPMIAGTLAFPSIDLTPYFAGIAAAFDAGEDWRAVELATGWFRDVNADIRLSAGSVQIGQLAFGETAASVSLHDSRLEIGVGQAAFNAGSLTGNLAVTHPADNFDATVEAQLRADGVDLAQVAPALSLPSPMSGRASLSIDLSGKGKNFGSLVNAAGGAADFAMANGAFPLFGMAEIAGGAAPTPQQAALATAAPVQAVSAAFSIAGGLAIVDQASVVAPSFKADAKGSIGLLDGALRLSGVAAPAGEGAGVRPPVPFTIAGTLNQPVARAD